MNTQGKSVLAVSVAAALGAVPDAADAAQYTATLTGVLTYSNNGTAGTAANISSSTATWTYDSVTDLLTQTGGLFNLRLTTAPTTTLYRTSITGLVLGNGAPASATTYVCQEGNFGTNVGSSICGNYSFGLNFANETTTTWGPGTLAAKTIGGDDRDVGPQQSIAFLNTFITQSSVLPPAGPTSLVLTNKTCTGICTTTAGGFNNGQQWTFGSLVEIFQGTVDDTASVEAGQPLSIDVLANDVGYVDPVTVTVTVAPNNGGTATVAGSPGPAAGIRINYTSAPGFSGTETFTSRAVAG
ncbi:MAG: Ig-like domain-containing protein, partial [Gammaproteobacteria bacterium]|nr:Ig-like domain-containing protein [Gammaproteobacteria bacterium]